jgi:glyoxylase I family protein
MLRHESASTRSAPFSADTTTAVARYQVLDVDRAIAFYTEHLGFHLEQCAGAVFATVSRGQLHVLLSGPGSSGSHPMPDGRRQEPGGWNRIVLYVDSLDAVVSTLKASSARFRNEVEVGPSYLRCSSWSASRSHSSRSGAAGSASAASRARM